MMLRKFMVVVLLLVAVPAFAATYTDNFNRTADLAGSTLSDASGTWSQVTGNTNSTNGTQLVINDGDNNYVASAETTGDDSYAKLNLVSCTGNSYGWIAVGVNTAATNGVLVDWGVGGSMSLYRIAGGAYTVVATMSWTPVAAVIEVRRIGTTGYVLIDGVQVLTGSVSGESTGSGNRHGLVGGYSNANSNTVDNFEYGDYSAGGGSALPLIHQQQAANDDHFQPERILVGARQ